MEERRYRREREQEGEKCSLMDTNLEHCGPVMVTHSHGAISGTQA